MKKNNIQVINILTISVAIHLFFTNARLLYHMNPDKVIEKLFSFTSVDEYTIIAMVFSLSYSLGTIFIAIKSRLKWLVLIFAIFDAIGILFYYSTDISQNLKSIYFSLYTGALLYSVYLIDNPKYLADQIVELKERGLNQKEIATTLGISESKVSRTNKRRKDE
jgi:drug/metabolite transporter (DMT)-like permease